MSKVVFELETRAPVTWCASDDEPDVFERQGADDDHSAAGSDRLSPRSVPTPR